MIDNGYKLLRFELLNWGNFHGYQKFQLSSDPDEQLISPLFAEPPASAILGVNGSGKSTLIDGLMITLLPFENLVRLGVTNDMETGGSGGRSIKDYILGKHSATGDNQITDSEGIFGRKTGSSMLLLSFVHNKNPKRRLTIGRLWWFNQGKVSDTAMAFVCHQDLTLTDLCEGSSAPKGPAAFRELGRRRPQLQIFDTMEAYFRTLSGALGNLTKEDLKLLNRAFFVKSITHIDRFIRENMLLEQDSPKLDLLLGNVAKGREISLQIKLCKSKIQAIEKVLKKFESHREFGQELAQLHHHDNLLRLLQEWSVISGYRLRLIELAEKTQVGEQKTPMLETEITSLKHQVTSLQSQIASDDSQILLQTLEQEQSHLLEKIKNLEQDQNHWQHKAAELGLKIPRTISELPAFQALLEKQQKFAEQETAKLASRLEQVQKNLFTLDQQVNDIKARLDHYSQANTLIPQKLHQIKQEACLELKLPAHHLWFVGELINLRAEFSKNRRAVESVLFPISRNLLVHPDSLHLVTRWLDQKGLSSDLVVKRIELGELDPPGWAQDHRENDQILAMIEILEPRHHPFTHYLWTWLNAKFDYRLVDVKEFKNKSAGLVVTSEGLVKSDSRTMRKLKKDFSYSLGWNNQFAIEELTQTLVSLNEKDSLLKKEQHSLRQQLKSLHTQELLAQRLFEELKSGLRYLELWPTLEQSELLAEKIQGLLKKSPQLEALKKDLAVSSELLESRTLEIAELKAELRQAEKETGMIQGLLPKAIAEMQGSTSYLQATKHLGSAQGVEQALVELSLALKKAGETRAQREAQIREKIHRLDLRASKNREILQWEMAQYQQEFKDPNLLSQLPLHQDLQEIEAQWLHRTDQLRETELPQVELKWQDFFDQVLFDSVKDAINEIKGRFVEIGQSIDSINAVLKLTNYEDLPNDQRFLHIDSQVSSDDRIRQFRQRTASVEKVLGGQIRMNQGTQSEEVMQLLIPFVSELENVEYRLFVTDIRNHFTFRVHSVRRKECSETGEEQLIETFTGARRDAKSSAQTTQLAYALLASSLAYRFRFHDPVRGSDSLRLIVLDEFGGKFDNEKPREIVKLLAQMGFQSLLVSPMSKGDLLATCVSHMVFVYKLSSTHSKVQSFPISSLEDYQKLTQLRTAAHPESKHVQ